LREAACRLALLALPGDDRRADEIAVALSWSCAARMLGNIGAANALLGDRLGLYRTPR
jgi:hypothetical protein